MAKKADITPWTPPAARDNFLAGESVWMRDGGRVVEGVIAEGKAEYRVRLLNNAPLSYKDDAGASISVANRGIIRDEWREGPPLRVGDTFEMPPAAFLESEGALRFCTPNGPGGRWSPGEVPVVVSEVVRSYTVAAAGGARPRVDAGQLGRAGEEETLGERLKWEESLKGLFGFPPAKK